MWRQHLDRFFNLTASGTTVGREVVAGLTTFAAMVYCVAVNPMIMAEAGMDRASVLTATCFIAIFSTTLMGLLANLPLGVAPAMGSNVVFAIILVKQMGVPWQSALALVFLTGVIFMIMSLTRLRERIAHDIPDTLRIGIQVAVGLVIMFIGMRNSGFVVPSPSTFVTMGPITSPKVLMTLAGFILTPVLVARRVPASLILSIIVLTIVGLFLPDGKGGTITRWPEHVFALPQWPRATAFQLQPLYLAQHILYVLPMLFFFLCTELFGTLANLLGVVKAAGMISKSGRIPRAREAFITDAAGSILAPLLGTSIVTVYSESITGVHAGGRTGLTALVIAGGFLASLFLWPLFMVIPPQATAPSLLMVGMMMFQGVRHLDLSDLQESAPAALTFIIALLTGNLINGMAIGTFSYTAMALATGRGRAIAPVVWGLCVIFILFFVVSARMHGHHV
ncbi:xanthine/uracil transporter [Gluconobacter thailandicus NBRC 3257]|uniref:Xanthine/uracil transporter n=1 Tax=Gluconobacter thailandicus NBRC 3257 TaxID=1381097 RepID=A0ABQ0IZZ9_GLUTH|nr:NCS2 family permease [Gluconobacter thailandicus]KXV53725.1 transporter [Gluconobacter thailandicus]GAC88606.1 xanthine/uracil transporter [Gluconobacter thailandicus NBRC 3255]GAD27778.1 xanthine/uracil transporter [Gluconobacter thailandicus NBRC 3257]GBR57268.1 xanthine/uracil transporter [Gluconobacter thailandicus F149-1 = NBRC 100600]